MLCRWDVLRSPCTLISGIVFVGFLLLLMAALNAYGAEHDHSDPSIPGEFYETWMIPGGQMGRWQSCCNKLDCYPTAFKQVGGTWFALRREDQRWIPVPDSKLEHMQPDPRESPDGRSHICARFDPANPDNIIVYCAVIGSGL